MCHDRQRNRPRTICPNATDRNRQAGDFGIAKTQLLVGTIGRLSDEKGFDLLIDAFALLVRQGLDAKLMIAGEGPEQAALQQQINSLGMSDRIRLVGFCEDTRRYLESLDIFVLSSHREGLPNVVLEAMAVGVPVIATRVGGVPRLVTDGVDGRLIDSGSVDQIANEIKKLASSPEQRAICHQPPRRRSPNDRSFRRRMERIADLYRQLG